MEQLDLGDLLTRVINHLLSEMILQVATPLKNISQLGWLFPIYGKIKNVPNHQPVKDFSTSWPPLYMMDIIGIDKSVKKML